MRFAIPRRGYRGGPISEGADPVLLATPLPLLAICSCSSLRNPSPASVLTELPLLASTPEATGLCMAGDSCSLDFPEEEINSEVVKP